MSGTPLLRSEAQTSFLKSLFYQPIVVSAEIRLPIGMLVNFGEGLKVIVDVSKPFAVTQAQIDSGEIAARAGDLVQVLYCRPANQCEIRIDRLQ